MAAALLFSVMMIIAISQDFLWFLFGLLIALILLVVTLGCIGWSIAKRRGWRSAALAVLILTATLPMMRLVQSAWDWSSVAIWSLSHEQEIASASGKDAIVTGWSDRGWAGGSTFSYVIADRLDDSRSTDGAERWRKRLKLVCPVSASQRIWRGLYLIETTDCPFDGIAFLE
ncbi:hypothetical protein [Novosphingobium terrae]|uniref:hypothetical protein n=1 Tax=Novosphingobium terrae TaxID=2726189 RepID=UPI00197E1D10|nr:hypothetical protein [Novosphingobium terrae]